MQTLTKIVVRSQVAITIKLSFDSAKDDVTLRLADRRAGWRTGERTGERSQSVINIEILMH